MISPGALGLLDAVVAGAIEEPQRNDPPQSPVAGQAYLVGDAPTGEWSQYAGHVASYGTGGWRFVAPVVGLALVDKSTGMVAAFGEAGWETGTVRAGRILIGDRQVVGPQAGPIANPAGGTTVDAEARLAIEGILGALRQHGLIST